MQHEDTPKMEYFLVSFKYMDPHISVITLGVKDLERAVGFYKDGLGFSTGGIVGDEFTHGAVAFFDLQSGLKLALWPYESIAQDTKLSQGSHNPTQITIGHNVNSRNEVDEIMSIAQSAGATIVKTAKDTFWGGYAGYFQDPDGHLWEVVWNPGVKV